MKWFDGLKAAIPGLLASPGPDAGAENVLEDVPSSVRQVAIIGTYQAASLDVLFPLDSALKHSPGSPGIA